MGCILSTAIIPHKRVCPTFSSNHSKDGSIPKEKTNESVPAVDVNACGDTPNNISKTNDNLTPKETCSCKSSEEVPRNNVVDSNDNMDRAENEQYYFLEIKEDCSDEKKTDIEYIIRTQPTSRFKKLEPLKNAPKLTVDILEKKMKKVEDKRNQMIQRRKNGKLHKNKSLDNEDKMENIKERISTAEKKREAVLQKIRDKQSLQHERAKRAKDRVDRMREIDQELLNELEIMNEAENDESCNSWPTLEGSNSQGRLTVSNGSGSGENPLSRQSYKGTSCADCQEFEKECFDLDCIVGPGISSGSSSHVSKKEFPNSPPTGLNLYQYPKPKRSSSSVAVLDSFYDI